MEPPKPLKAFQPWIKRRKRERREDEWEDEPPYSETTLDPPMVTGIKRILSFL
jgi:hypothetical protein